MKKSFVFFLLVTALIASLSKSACAAAAQAIINSDKNSATAKQSPQSEAAIYHCFASNGALIYSAIYQEIDLKAEKLPLAVQRYLQGIRRRFGAMKEETDAERLLFFPAIAAGFTEKTPYNRGYTKNNLPKTRKAVQLGEHFAFITELKQSPDTFSLVTIKTVRLAGKPHTRDVFAATFQNNGKRLNFNETLNRHDSADVVARKALEILANHPYKNQLRSDWQRHVYDFCANPYGDGWYVENGNVIVLYPARTVLDTDTIIQIPLAQLSKK